MKGPDVEETELRLRKKQNEREKNFVKCMTKERWKDHERRKEEVTIECRSHRARRSEYTVHSTQDESLAVRSLGITT